MITRDLDQRPEDDDAVWANVCAVAVEVEAELDVSNFRPNPRLVRLAPEAPKFSFGDLLVDTGPAPRTS